MPYGGRRNTYFFGDTADPQDPGAIWVRQSDNAILVSSGNAWRGIGGSFNSINMVGAKSVILGTGLVPTTAAGATAGLIMIPVISSGVTALTAVATTGSAWVTFSTVTRAFQVKVAGTWFTAASMEIV